MGPDYNQDSQVAARLLGWYDTHARRLPWRVPPGSAERAVPYRVWLSEIMLQQTTVATVKGAYARFLARWPTVEVLAAAPREEVLAEWAGLGYYARARNLHACAQAVAALGAFPDTEEGLRALPGIGAYTAAAIVAIAFGRPAVVVDGNVERVVARCFAVREPLPGARPALRALTARISPRERPGDFAQAMMDLGATVCTPRKPACAICPLFDLCAAAREGIAADLPRKAPKKPRPTRYGAAFVAQRGDGAVLIEARPDKGLLGGMMQPPNGPWRDAAPGEPRDDAPFAAEWRYCGEIEHVFTHFRLVLSVYHARVAGGAGRWAAPDDLDALALPTVMRKALARGLG